MRHLPFASLVVAVVAVTTLAQPALAQPAPASAPASDVIHLKSGGQLRGTIVDVVPGSHARIQLATGEVVTVPWSDVVSVDSAARSPTPPQPPPPTTPTAPPPPPAALAQKLVHIEAPRQVTLERQSPNPKVWIAVCASPCDRYVPASGTYRIAGRGVRKSASFVLDVGPDARVFIDVDPGSRGWFASGIVFTSLGGVATIVGAVLTIVGAADGHLTASEQSSFTTAGVTMAAIGLVTLVGGLVAISSNATTTSVAPTPPTGEAALRAPTWTSPALVGAPKPLVFPAFTASF